MTTARVDHFDDPEEYSRGVSAADVELTVIGRGKFASKITLTELDTLWMRRYAETLSRIGYWTIPSGRSVLSFRTHAGPEMRMNGIPLRTDNLIWQKQGYEGYRYSAGPALSGAVSLPVDEFASFGAMAGRDLMPPPETMSISPRPVAMQRLLRRHAAVGHLAENAAEMLSHAEVVHAIRQDLIEAMVDCVVDADAGEDSVARHQHDLVIRRFHRFLESNPDQPVYVPEICRAINVSSRTLLSCCQEHLALSPKQFLKKRRFYLVNRALLDADPASTTVTDVAMRFGFYHLGRFAGEYHAIYSEAPSVTLHR